MDADCLADMPWPRLLALSEGKGEQMSWGEFQEMIAKKQKAREQTDG